MEIVIAITTGVLSSICASVIFLFFLTKIRPNLEISDTIAVEEASDGTKKYWLKFINQGRRDIINVRFELLFSTPQNAANGMNIHRKTIPLTKASMLLVSAYSENDQNKSYAKRFSTTEDLDELWNDECSFLTLRIIGEDSVSGFSKIFVKDMHYKKTTLKPGRHKIGLSLEVE
ncbi:MAG: hypothetical protein GY737_14555 [Desulfobacteraceae bacterium]|nr:hypothetical protein [Desulfobacteraceae bacterium]